MLQIATDEEKIAFVTELHKGSEYARSLDLFPDTLDVKIETVEGTEVLNLVKQKSVHVRSIPVQYDISKLNQRQFKLTKVSRTHKSMIVEAISVV